ncbi:Wound-induced protein Wun1-like [Dillenia turbinata]|uniref:Wound-induced protein Wun1-like n=1 Tax=Dillenia turbinata TaxID=194707 RepID=A0AAN8ZJA6_9MAGN
MAGEHIESSPMPQIMPKQETHNKETIVELYNALAQGNTDTVAGLLATDLEWWFHGPSHCQYMMKVLTGESPVIEFRFEPRSVTAIDDRVIAEGWEGAQAYWVHVWTLKDGLITQFREYFNTWLTVRDLKPVGWAHRSPTLWQSQPRDLYKRSLPGLILGI